MLCDEDPKELLPLNEEVGLGRNVFFVTDGDIQMHLIQKDVLNSFRLGQMVNLLERGHIACKIDNILAFMAHLGRQEVLYSDCSSDAVKLGTSRYFL